MRVKLTCSSCSFSFSIQRKIKAADKLRAYVDLGEVRCSRCGHSAPVVVKAKPAVMFPGVFDLQELRDVFDKA